MEPTAAQFGHLFSWRSSMDLSHAAAYRYNHNMMEYYTCKSKSGIAIRKQSTDTNENQEEFQKSEIIFFKSGIKLIKLLDTYLGVKLSQINGVRHLNKCLSFYRIGPCSCCIT